MSQTSRQFDWMVAISWLAALAFCVACFVVVVLVIEWAA